MKKTGFTLIELLAVIVVLAIIALIATPIVMDVIKGAKKSATLRSAENYMDATTTAIATTNMKEGGAFQPTLCSVTEDGNLNCDGFKVEDKNPIIVEINGQKPNGGSITLDNGKVVDVNLKYSDGATTLDIVDDGNGKLVYAEKPKFSFATDSWATIKANVNTGVYNVGDEKEIELDVDGTIESYTVRIANLPSEKEKTEGCGTEGFSETACGFVVEFVDIISAQHANPYGTNLGGWPASEMRKYIGGYKDTNGNIVEGTIYKVLPDDLKSVLKDTYVVSSRSYTGAGTRSDENFESTDKLYLLSSREVYGNESASDKTANPNVTRQLDYYKEKGVTTSNNSETIKMYKGFTYGWWLSSLCYHDDHFFSVSGKGMWYSDTAGNTTGVAPAFRIG